MVLSWAFHLFYTTIMTFQLRAILKMQAITMVTYREHGKTLRHLQREAMHTMAQYRPNMFSREIQAIPPDGRSVQPMILPETAVLSSHPGHSAWIREQQMIS